MKPSEKRPLRDQAMIIGLDRSLKQRILFNLSLLLHKTNSLQTHDKRAFSESVKLSELTFPVMDPVDAHLNVRALHRTYTT